MNSNKPRQEATIPIGGLDTSTPDELAPNGTCATLHNLRYVDNAWHGVGPLTPLAEIPFGSTTEGSTTTTYFVKILYKHLASPDNKYIAFIKKKVTTEQGGGGSSRMELVGYAEVDITAQRPNPDGTMTTITDTVAMAQQAVLLDGLDANTDYTFTHFGKVLIAQGGGSSNYFIHDTDTNKYSPFQVPRPVRMIHRVKQNEVPSYDSGFGDIGHFWPIIKNGEPIRKVNEEGNTWWGEICCFVAYRMKDGTVLSPSALHIICSEKTNGSTTKVNLFEKGKTSPTNNIDSYICVNADDNPTELQQLRRILPELRIYIPEGIDTSLVDRIALYSTRINPFLDYGKMCETWRYNMNYLDYAECYADNDLPSQPFYLVEEVRIDKNKEWIVELGYNKLKDLEAKGQRYEPTQVHSFIAGTQYEYNHRLHFGDLTSTLFSHVSPLRLQDGYNGNELREMVVIPSIGSQFSYSIEKDGFNSETEELNWGGEYGVNPISNGPMLVSPILSYPDFRATKIYVVDLEGQYINSGVFNLRPATANNFAYYITPHTNVLKYPRQDIIVNTKAPFSLSVSPTFSEPNRLQVSKAGNCFALPVDTSYNIGNEDTHILALGTAAEMLADSRFGETPLYVFTNEGVWAAIQGQGGVLYSNWAFINPDRIINGSTAVANGLLFYITARGIHAISGRQSKLISTPIDDEGGQSPDFSSAEMWVQHLNNELVIYRGHNADDFVYNIDNGYWSTRTNCGRKIAQKQTVKETLWIDADYPTTGGSTQYIRIYDCEHEVNETVKASVTTRPIKLQRGAIARIENIITRLSGVARITIEIKGSNNLVDWATLRNVTFSPADRSVTIRHLPASAVYHVITLSADITLRKSITLFDITFYTKYLHKMR